jgi:alkylhydroperoxidase family enzyme
MKPVPLQDWDASLQHVIDDMDGRPLNIHSLMANHPRLLDAWWDLRKYSVNGGDLEQRHCEIAILRVAARMDSWYEWASHVERGLACGLSLEEIERVKAGPAAVGWDAREAALLIAIDNLVEKQSIMESTLQELGDYFTQQQVLDMILLYGMYNTIACMINTWGLELDAHVTERLPRPVTESSF